MACVWKSPKSRYWIAQFPDGSGKRINRSTKEIDRRRAQTIAETWEKAARKAARHELTQAQSIRVLDELMRESLGANFEVQSIEVFLHGWVASRTTMKRATSTTDRYQGIVDDFLTFIGPRKSASIASVSTDEIEKWRDSSLREGISHSTADFNVKVLSIGLDSARRKGLALSNPTEAVELLGSTQEEREVFSSEELRKLLKTPDKEWRGMILFGAHLGLRIADAANLTWGQLDTTEKTLSIIPGKTKRTAPKPRILVLHDEIVDWLHTQTRGTETAPIFPSLHGKKTGSHGGLSNAFGRIMASAGIKMSLGAEKTGKGRRMRGKSFHSLRHTMISRLANEGVNADVRKTIAGHGSDSAHKRYVHLSLESQRKAVAGMGWVS